jgi:hypothetical protein
MGNTIQQSLGHPFSWPKSVFVWKAWRYPRLDLQEENSSLWRFTKDTDSLQRIDAASSLLATEGIFLGGFQRQ